MTTKPIAHFSLLGPNAYSTSVVMGNRAFIRMWSARRAAKLAGHPIERTLPSEGTTSSPLPPPAFVR